MTPSKARQKLRHIQEQLPELLQPFFTRYPLLPAYVYATQRKCGNPRCRCARGELHPRHSICFQDQGQRRCYSLTPEQRTQLQPQTDNYRRFREARRQLRRTVQDAFELIDSLERALSGSPEQAVAQVKARGR